MKITYSELYQSVPKAEELWLSRLPPDEKIPEHTFSKRFERKMNRLLRDQRRSSGVRKMVLASKRLAAAMLILAILSFSALMSVEAYREKFIETVTEVLYDLTHFSFFSTWNGSTKIGETTFGYLPEGMVEIDRVYDQDNLSQTVYFEDTEGRQLHINLQMVTDKTAYDVIWDTELSDVTKTDISGNEAILVAKGEWAALMWLDDPFVLWVAGELAPAELTQIAEGISISVK